MRLFSWSRASRVRRRHARCSLAPSLRRPVAQANLSTQGFGFPTGQLSTRALGTGGALGRDRSAVADQSGEHLAASARGSSSSRSSRSIRTVIDRRERAHDDGALPERVRRDSRRSAGSLSLGVVDAARSHVDDVFNTSQFLSRGDSVPMTTHVPRSTARMDDVRLAGAWTPTSWLRVGVGAARDHRAQSGQRHAVVHRLRRSSRRSPSSACSVQRDARLRPAFSSSRKQLIGRALGAAAAATCTMSAEDTVLSRARRCRTGSARRSRTPASPTRRSRCGRRTTIGRRSAASALRASHAVDAWDTSVGADMAGPQVGDTHRVSARRVPRRARFHFRPADQTVTEKSFTGGLGTPFANGHVLADLRR